jgi:hypothetical protein
MSFVINLDYTGTGRVEVKIQVMANNHEEAFKTAQNILNQQKSWYRKHKEELIADQEHYKKILQFGPGYVEPHEERVIMNGETESKPLYPHKRIALRTGVF